MCGVGLLKFYKFKPPKKLLVECGEIISNEQMKGLPLTQEIWDEQKM